MKYKLAALLMVSLSIFLVGCHQGTDYVLQEEFRTEDYMPDFDMQMQYKPDTSTGICKVDDIYYFSAYPSEYIYYVDEAQNISEKLCGKPECDHESQSCNAYIGRAYGGTLQVYDGRLYFVDRSGILYRMNMDGTERERVMQIDIGNGDLALVIHRGYVYVKQINTEIVNGQTSYKMLILQYVLGDQESKKELYTKSCDQGYIECTWVLRANQMYLWVEEKDGGIVYETGFYQYNLADGTIETLREEEAAEWRMRDVQAREDGFTLIMRSEEEQAFQSIFYDYEKKEWTENFEIKEEDPFTMFCIGPEQYICFPYYLQGEEPTYDRYDKNGVYMESGTFSEQIAGLSGYRVLINSYGADESGNLLLIDLMRTTPNGYDERSIWIRITPEGEPRIICETPST
jgi:hypothetical protein